MAPACISSYMRDEGRRIRVSRYDWATELITRQPSQIDNNKKSKKRAREIVQ